MTNGEDFRCLQRFNFSLTNNGIRHVFLMRSCPEQS